ncbi:FliH/SctL family protein [Gemmobacter serpentinus]|uniref:flagellar biosynthesis protein n=1 Tax=Gemmobacter serpentinus TaxID=2652247 RepID=UPI00124E24A4|nr:flagellar biosynthesis protein [Gemmobacter serpentinus]
MSGLKLEIFSQGKEAPESAATVDPAVQEAHLAIYEQGYRAGWDDATTAQSADQRKIRVDLAHSLQTLSFTFHEARAHVLQALAPLMEEMVARILPDLARQALVPMVVDQLRPLAEGLADAPLILMVHPQDREGIQAQLDRIGNLPVALREEPSLAQGQVCLGRGPQEVEVDLQQAVRAIAQATRGFFGLSEQE